MTLAFITLGVFFMGVSLLVTPEEQDIDVSEANLQLARRITSEQSSPEGLSPTLQREVARILLTGQSTLMEASEKANLKKKQDAERLYTN